MWVWVLAAGLFMLAALLFFFLYRKAKLALENRSNPADALTVDGVAVLLGELEAAGEAIVERLEAKQREVDQMLRLLDAKLELLQVGLAAKPGYDLLHHQAGKVASTAPALIEARLDTSNANEPEMRLGEKQELVLRWEQQGLSPVEIAQRTDLKLDEVRLILSLFQSNK